jgi:hypothetical protein
MRRAEEVSTRTRSKSDRHRALRNVLAIVFSLLALYVFADSNACGGCDEGGCGNNWVCTGVILGQLSDCCGAGSGRAVCKGGTFCVTCDAGGSCGCGGLAN